MQLDPTAFLADPELIRALNEHATPIVCDTDRILFHQDDPAVGLYILHEGKVTLSMASHQGQAILSVEARRRFHPRPSRTHQQPALLAHGGCARRSAGQFSRPRGIPRAHAVEPGAGVSRSCRFSPPKSAPRATRSTKASRTSLPRRFPHPSPSHLLNSLSL